MADFGVDGLKVVYINKCKAKRTIPLSSYTLGCAAPSPHRARAKAISKAITPSIFRRFGLRRKRRRIDSPFHKGTANKMLAVGVVDKPQEDGRRRKSAHGYRKRLLPVCQDCAVNVAKAGKTEGFLRVSAGDVFEENPYSSRACWLPILDGIRTSDLRLIFITSPVREQAQFLKSFF
ncbi:MAG: hypothetical protein ABW189_05170 [Rickettsiales bacterium]